MYVAVDSCNFADPPPPPCANKLKPPKVYIACSRAHMYFHVSHLWYQALVNNFAVTCPCKNFKRGGHFCILTGM